MKQRTKISLLCLVFFLFASFMFSEQCHALDPFDNIPFPEGKYFLTYPIYYTADRLKDGSGNTSVSNLDLDSYVNLFRFCYYNKTTFDNAWTFSFIQPVGRVEILGEHDQGIGDATVCGGYWFIDNPDSKTWFGAIGYVDIPIGDYDPAKSANMGANMWKFRPSLIFAKQFGKFDLELTAKYNIYTENKDIDTKPGQETIIESYLGYFLRPSLMLGGHFNATFGQDKTVGGSDVPDSSVKKYQAGPSINWTPASLCCITFETLFDFGVENSTSGQLYLVRLAWKI